MEIDLNKLFHALLGSSWFIPAMLWLRWSFKKYVSEDLTSKQTFNNYVEAQEKKDKELKEDMEEADTKNGDYIIVVDRKAQDNAKAISGLETGAEALEKAIDRIENRLDK